MKRFDSPVGVRRSIPNPSDDEADVSREERLLATYENLRAELRVRIQMGNRRNTRGIAVIGVIVGSAIVRDFHLLVFVPLIAGFLLVESVRSYQEVIVVVRHLIAIEWELSEQGSPFRYESQRGGAFGELRERPRLLDLSWSSVPKLVQLLLVGLTYGVIGLVLVSGWNPAPELFGYVVKRQYVSVGFGLLTMLLALTSLSFVVQHRRLRNEIATADS
jgi:hypothetical protein